MAQRSTDASSLKHNEPKSVRDVLVAARKLIEEPKCWAQGWDAKLFGQLPTCAGGAIDAVDPGGMLTGCINALGFTDCSRLIAWNDAPIRTHAEVLAAFDRAIAATGAA